jgi:CarD family transcriptional regulator
MYESGDRVFHPMHGIGIIESIISQEVMGEKRKYYIVNLTTKKMEISVPVEAADEIGIRRIGKSQMIEDALGMLKKKQVSDAPTEWNQRFKFNMAKIKTGNIKELAQVLVNLRLRSQKSRLSISEMLMMDNVVSLIAGELSYSKNIEYEEAKKHIEKALN